MSPSRAALRVPSKASLEQALSRANLVARVLLGIELLAAGALFGALDWQVLSQELGMALAVVGLVIAGRFMGVPRLLVENKKRIEELRDDVLFGEHTKARLLQLVAEVEQAMGLPAKSIRAYITREKDLNAAAIQLGLASLFPALNAIRLNRATIHCLNRAELATVIAHEAAHNERYFLIWHRYTLWHCLFAIMASLLVLQLLGATTTALLAVIGFNFALQWTEGMLLGNFAHTLEYLCDFAGAQVANLETAITAELKIAARAEAFSKAYAFVLQQKIDGCAISSTELLHLMQEAVPFGNFDGDELQGVLKGKIEEVERSRDGMSLQGFLDFIGVRESVEKRQQYQEILDQLAVVRKLPKLSVNIPTHGALSREEIEELVSKIYAAPDHVLFHTENEVLDLESTHPGVRKRILFLWENRAAL